MASTLETLTVHAVTVGGKMREIVADRSDQFRPENLTSWELRHRPVTVEDEIVASRFAVAQGLYGPGGTDEDAVLLAKGLALAERCVVEWDRKAADGTEMPVTPENVRTLPAFVLRRFGYHALYGGLPTAEEFASAKK